MPVRAPMVRVVSNLVGRVSLGAMLVVAGGCSNRSGEQSAAAPAGAQTSSPQPTGSLAAKPTAKASPTGTAKPDGIAKSDPAFRDRALASAALIDESAGARRELFSNLPDDPTKSAEAIGGHFDATITRFEKLAAINQGAMRKNMEVMVAHLKAGKPLGTEFQQANLGLLTDEFLDLEKSKPTAIARWIAVVERYNKAVEAYREFTANPPVLLAYVAEAQREGGDAEKYARDLLAQNETESKSFLALMALRLEFGRSMLNMLKYLQTHAGEWTVGKDEFTFKDSARQAGFDKLMKEFAKQGQAAAKAEEEFEKEMATR